MKAGTVTQTGRARAEAPAPIQHLLLSEFSQVKSPGSGDNFDADKIALQATQITVVLKNILEQPGYRHGGLNE